MLSVAEFVGIETKDIKLPVLTKIKIKNKNNMLENEIKTVDNETRTVSPNNAIKRTVMVPNDAGKLVPRKFAVSQVFANATNLHNEDVNEKQGLWDNIHAKQARIKNGSGEKMRKPGSAGAPSNKDLKDSQVENVTLGEDSDGYKNPTGGLTQKGRDHYNSTTGSNLKAPVTTPPSELKTGSKAANRRKSFCARMSGVDGPMKKPNGEPSRKALALKKWNCRIKESIDLLVESPQNAWKNRMEKVGATDYIRAGSDMHTHAVKKHQGKMTYLSSYNHLNDKEEKIKMPKLNENKMITFKDYKEIYENLEMSLDTAIAESKCKLDESAFDWKGKASIFTKPPEVPHEDGVIVHKAREHERNAETGGKAGMKAVGRPAGVYDGAYKIDKSSRDTKEYKDALSKKVRDSKAEGFAARSEYKKMMNDALKKRQAELAK